MNRTYVGWAGVVYWEVWAGLWMSAEVWEVGLVFNYMNSQLARETLRLRMRLLAFVVATVLRSLSVHHLPSVGTCFSK